jgi:uncharacterized membrane protein
MKKILALVVAAFVFSAVVGCSGDTTTKTTSSSSGTTTKTESKKETK